MKPLCPTRWTVRTRSLGAIASNYAVLTIALLEIHEGGRDEYALKAGGYLATMDKFSTYFGIKLSYLLFSATEQLSMTLQGQDTTIQEAVSGAHLAIKFLENQRNDDKFDRFYSRIVEDSKELTTEPVLPRYKRPPRRFDEGSTQGHRFEDAKCCFRQQYFEALDTASGELEKRFQQTRGMPVAAALERTLLQACNNRDSILDIPEEIKLYSKEIDVERLKLQLQMLPDLLRTYNEKNPATVIKSYQFANTVTLCVISTAVKQCSVRFLIYCTLHPQFQ